MSEAGGAEFFVVQRCATYGFWLEPLVFESEQFETVIETPQENAKLKITICLKHYGNVPDHSEPPKVKETETDFAFGSSSPMGFVAGAEYYIGPEGGRVSLKRRYPFEGELDIFFRLQSSGELPPVELQDKYIELMPALLLVLRITTQDVIVPTWRLQTVTKIGGDKGRQASGASLRLVPKERGTVTQEQIASALSYFSRFLHPESSEETIIRLAVAARRIMKGFNETDLIDRYCDLWEACEVLCPYRRPQYVGKIDNRIAKMLAVFTKLDHQLIKTKIISELYNIRKDVVHTYTENLTLISDKLPIMFDVATLLFASRIGFRYGRKGPLFDCLQPASAV